VRWIENGCEIRVRDVHAPFIGNQNELALSAS